MNRNKALSCAIGTVLILSFNDTWTAAAFFFHQRQSKQLEPSQTMPVLSRNSPTSLASGDTIHSKYEKRAAGFWNRLANHYFKQPIQDEEAYKKKLEITRGYLTPQFKVLEIGCGTGGTAIKHAPYVTSIHAIDFSSKMIEIAQSQLDESNPSISNVMFQCIGIDSFQAPKASYDVVLGLSLLHLLPNKDKVLDRIHEMVKPGGYFISSTTCMGDFAGTFLKYVAPPISSIGLLPKLNVFTKEELRASIEKAGFSIDEEFQPGNEKDKAVFLVAKKVG